MMKNKELSTLKNLFSELILKYGHNNKLSTFDVCSSNGIELCGSTIDEISIIGDYNICFYYSVSENDFDTIGAFGNIELSDFYDKLLEAFSNTDNFTNIVECVKTVLLRIFSERQTSIILDNYKERIVEFVLNKYGNNFTMADVEVAVRYVLAEKLM